MLGVDIVQWLEGVAGVVAAPQSALVADTLAAGPAVYAQLLLVELALVLTGFTLSRPAGSSAQILNKEQIIIKSILLLRVCN